jgi:hypothetical protein
LSRYHCTKCDKNHNDTSKKGIAHLEFAKTEHICPTCGYKLDGNIVICWYCGECVNDQINAVVEKDKVPTTPLQDAVLRALKTLRRAKTSTIAKKLQVNTNVITPTLVSLRKKGLVKSKDGATEKVWIRT